ncbi:hypothetical protein BSI_02080 [Bacillus inaquosorum KCTC 13429]|uniref:Uncharacterized protein n=1 Tax=Bacillus inaquosorum KCTC 13429 TaxID=1236548 RepID=A0A9W5LLD7_9BACI|nr:hypothetical protein BSI_02080 [Bacillus inaquosorum KCTC 13429]
MAAASNESVWTAERLILTCLTPFLMFQEPAAEPKQPAALTK